MIRYVLIHRTKKKNKMTRKNKSPWLIAELKQNHGLVNRHKSDRGKRVACLSNVKQIFKTKQLDGRVEKRRPKKIKKKMSGISAKWNAFGWETIENGKLQIYWRTFLADVKQLNWHLVNWQWECVKLWRIKSQIPSTSFI